MYQKWSNIKIRYWCRIVIIKKSNRLHVVCDFWMQDQGVFFIKIYLNGRWYHSAYVFKCFGYQTKYLFSATYIKKTKKKQQENNQC